MFNFTPSQWAGFAADGAEVGLRAAKNVIKKHPKAMGSALFGIDLAITAGSAKKGEFVTDMSGAVTGNLGAIAGTALGNILGGPVGGIVGGIAGDYISRSATVGALKSASKLGKNARANFGGHYVDTAAAYTMRQRSAQELGGSLLNARRYLGSEGAMYH